MIYATLGWMFISVGLLLQNRRLRKENLSLVADVFAAREELSNSKTSAFNLDS